MARRIFMGLGIAMLLGLLGVHLGVDLNISHPRDECKARGYDFKDGAACVYDSRVNPQGSPGSTRYVIGIDWARAHNTESWAYIYGQEDGLRKGHQMVKDSQVISEERAFH